MVGKKKYIILVVTIISFGVLLIGGTYAYLTYSANTVNATYNTTGTCFVVDYTAGSAITGTMFQSSTPKGGLSGSVTMKINSSCTVNGKGTIKLTVSSDTDKKLVGDAHCENEKTLKTINCAITDSTASTTRKNFWADCSKSGAFAVTSSNCTTIDNAIWVADDSTPALKYAVYKDSGTSPVASGYVNTIGTVTLYTNFDITQTSSTYNVYVWLDGTMADNSYVNMPFSGYIHAEATQVE